MNESSLVLVTGGSRGLGIAIVKQLLKEGHQVATFSRKFTEEIKQLQSQFPGYLFHFNGDMARQETLEEIVKKVEKEIGPIESVVNNASIAYDGILATMPPTKIERLISINLTGTLLLTRLVVRQMIVRARGNVISISSIIGLRGYPGLAAYTSTKAGIDGMTRALAWELGPRNIRVNSIAPGYLETEMTEGLGERQRKQIMQRTPLRRLGRTEDVVGTVSFLLSPASSFITGQTIVIDGGITC